MENDGIQRLLKAEDDAANVIKRARDGQMKFAIEILYQSYQSYHSPAIGRDLQAANQIVPTF